ncbi:hypothetical protein PRIPAC_96042 [Pristionchus pacificus]|uniref:O-phosphoseryl-tRNA(Sec) selenium transferase n=1 Tax=Pristionchus pacificus TaxID=54126 RepID=A0A2A6D137_PRIPA|nr:hypothetical protein PRIPAC_96042 [Pristionchus pacificus]|eukprot:PDM83993.1 hypothetical protein PRIPAC_34185 [Pristionchus pacificus]
MMCMAHWRKARPRARYVIWSRVDQKSAFKAILAAEIDLERPHAYLWMRICDARDSQNAHQKDARTIHCCKRELHDQLQPMEAYYGPFEILTATSSCAYGLGIALEPLQSSKILASDATYCLMRRTV